MLALLVLAQDRGEQAAPDTGVGIPLIVGALVAVVLAGLLLWMLVRRGSHRARRVEPDAVPSQEVESTTTPAQPPAPSRQS